MYPGTVLIWILILFLCGVVSGIGHGLVKKGVKYAYLPYALYQTFCSLILYPLIFPILLALAKKDDILITDLAKDMIKKHRIKISVDDLKQMIIRDFAFPRSLTLWFRLIKSINSNYNEYIKFSLNFSYLMVLQNKRSASSSDSSWEKVNPKRSYIFRSEGIFREALTT